ncbi:hypothetical protein GCK32_021800 [Trichostrongylus colubriformis]|uniref:Uncharacterized protein n=1 Tax=Trichostrongylus colubriformis TaxID=6319 RepID=A0AAN8F2T5_TRICO
MDTPVFDKSKLSHIKKGPSSAATVLTMAGMFVVGILLMMSGTIVLIVVSSEVFIFIFHANPNLFWSLFLVTLTILAHL